jgi:hypothetical protein
VRHNILEKGEPGDHWSVGASTNFLEGDGAGILVQLQERGNQVRLRLSIAEAEEMVAELLLAVAEARAAKPILRPQRRFTS